MDSRQKNPKTKTHIINFQQISSNNLLSYIVLSLCPMLLTLKDICLNHLNRCKCYDIVLLEF